jgi:hypothetical protein
MCCLISQNTNKKIFHLQTQEQKQQQQQQQQ